ncbi:hypothetical protein [Telluribacter humicola]|uniref:hypothetical protein n=1 Tax=Telluribacter humicola TaxID=1720261 RepID=UPI001A97AFA3|nr:hypothetical protein [Telluribacter humicola]
MVVANSGFCQNFILTGKFDGSEVPTSLNLYKYNNYFDSQFVATIPVEGDSFFYNNSKIKETDAYYLADAHNSDKSYWFFWEGENELLINTEDYSKSMVKNSPLTEERDRYERIVFDKFHAEIKTIDKQLSELKKDVTKNQVKIDKLTMVRSQKWDQGTKDQATFERNYILENVNSIFSLYLLTCIGIEMVNEDSRQLFNSLNESVKRHSRGKIFME